MFANERYCAQNTSSNPEMETDLEVPSSTNSQETKFKNRKEDGH